MSNTMTTEPLTFAQTQAMLIQRQRQHAQVQAEQEKLAQLDAALLQAFEAHNIKSLTDPTGRVTLTRTTQVRTKVSEELVQANVGRNLWHKLSVRKLDLTRWNVLKAAGLIKPEVVELCESTSETAPFFTQTVH